MNLISYPFRLKPNGSVASVDQNTPQADAEQVAMLLLTKKGERQLVPGFGISDVTLGMLDVNEVASAISVYYPGLNITGIRPVWVNDGFLSVEVEF